MNTARLTDVLLHLEYGSCIVSYIFIIFLTFPAPSLIPQLSRFSSLEIILLTAFVVDLCGCNLNCQKSLFAIQAVVWTDSSSGLVQNADHKAEWKAFSIPLELHESITAVDFAPVGLAAER